MLNKKHLSGGAELLFIENRRFKTTRITVSFFLPLELEGYSERAMLPFFLSSCCEKYDTPAALSRRANELYGAVISATTEKIGMNRRIGFTVSALDDRYSIDSTRPMTESARLLNEIIFRPARDGEAFRDVDFEREHRMFIETVESERNDKRQFARTRCEEEIFAGKPCGLPELGTPDGAKAITKSGLYDAWRDMLRRGSVLITVVGAAVPDGFEDDLTAALSTADRHPCGIDAAFEQIAERELREVTDREEITQGKLVIGVRTAPAESPRDAAVLAVANDIFGGGTHSKLFSIVREQLHLCYYCSSRVDRIRHLMLIDSGVDMANAEKARDSILEQLAEVKKGNFADSDLAASRKGLINSVRTTEDTASLIDRWYTSRAVDGSFISPDDYRGLLADVTREDVIRAAADLAPDTVYFMLPKEAETDEN